MNIIFSCTNCGQCIEIDEAGAGLQVQCPNCGQSLTVPVVIGRVANPAPLPTSDTKKCPYCAETIKAEAKVCRFCNHDLVTSQSGLLVSTTASPMRAVSAETVAMPLVNRARQMVIVGLVGSIILAMSAMILIQKTIDRCQRMQMFMFTSTADVGCWYEGVPRDPSGYLYGTQQMIPPIPQFSVKKFLSSSEGRAVIILALGSVGFLAVAGAGYGLKRKIGSSSAVSAPP